MRWGWGLFLGLLGLALLLGFPPLLKGAVEGGLALLGFRGEVREVRGHLLWGLRLKGVRLEGQGLALEAEEVDLAYDLLGLFRRELPLSLGLRKAVVRPTWEALVPEGGGPPPAFRFLFQSLRLEDVAVELPRGERLFLPPLRLTLLGENPYRFLARLPGGSFQGEARALSPDLAAWEVGFSGEVRGLSFFYEGLKGGRLSGALRLGPQGVFGEAEVREGAVEVVGFPLEGVEGTLRLEGGRVEARLRGRGLEGPVAATAEVDLKAPRYRFLVEGRPSLRALALHYGLALPVEGDGRLVLEGEGWEALRLQGAFQGEGRLLGEPFRHQGTLSFREVFALEARVEGRLFDRTYTLEAGLEGGRYWGRYRDSLGSALALFGEGGRYEGEGRAAWPKPLEGLAAVRFQGEGSRYRVVVEGPGARLPLFPPLDLSGEVVGEGERVSGRVGPLTLAGTWGDLALRLRPTPLLVGQVEGEGRLEGGRLLADLRYASPYAAFPVRVRQGEGAFFLESPYGEGSYRGGVFALRLEGLPLRLLEEARLYGEAVYREGALSGALRLEGRALEARARLRGLAADLEGRLSTPLGTLPLSGAYDPEAGLRLLAGGLRLTYREALRLAGEAALGGFRLRADLAYGEGFSGWASLEGPLGLRGRLWGEGGRLLLALSGPVEGEGEVFPGLALSGRILPPWPEGLAIPPLAFRLTREALELPGVGRVELSGRYPFLLDLPFRYRGVEGRLRAQGDLEGGSVALSTPFGALRGAGAWRALALEGSGDLPALGPWTLKGEADLFALAYRGEAALPRAGLVLELSGKGAALRFTGEAPGLALAGGYGEGLALSLSARGYDLAPFGLPARLWGDWGLEGGRLRVETPYGQAVLEGTALLRARLFLKGPYLEGEGEVFPEGLSLRFSGRYRASGVAVEGKGEGGGPWGALRFRLAGEARVPYLEPLPFRGEVEVADGVRYRLQGPLALEGEGAGYRGSFPSPSGEVLGKGLSSRSATPGGRWPWRRGRCASPSPRWPPWPRPSASPSPGRRGGGSPSRGRARGRPGFASLGSPSRPATGARPSPSSFRGGRRGFPGTGGEGTLRASSGFPGRGGSAWGRRFRGGWATGAWSFPSRGPGGRWPWRPASPRRAWGPPGPRPAWTWPPSGARAGWRTPRPTPRGRGASALREAATSFGGASEASPTSGRRGLSAWWERGLRRCFPGRRPWPSGRPTGRGLPSPSGARGRSWA